MRGWRQVLSIQYASVHFACQLLDRAEEHKRDVLVMLGVGVNQLYSVHVAGLEALAGQRYFGYAT